MTPYQRNWIERVAAQKDLTPEGLLHRALMWWLATYNYTWPEDEEV